MTAATHRLLLATVPAAGHVGPLLPIASELVDRGSEVVWCTGRAFRAAVEETGATWVPIVSAHDPFSASIVDRFPGRAGLEGLDGIRFDLKHLFLDEIPHQVRDLQHVLESFPADVVVADAGMMGAAATHELGGPPWVTVGITPLPFPSRDVAPFGTGLPPIRTRRDRLRGRGVASLQRWAMREVERHHRQVRAGLGLAPSRQSVLAGAMSPYLFLQSGTQAFEYPRSDLPRHVHFVGPLLPRSTPAASSGIDWSERAQGRPLVLVTQGTVATSFNDLVGPTLRALADEDVFVVAVSATGEPAVVPGNAAVERYIPYEDVLRHASAAVTNGGYGGVQHALTRGVPLVVAGSTEDKPEVAARVAWSGAGIDLRTGHPTEEQIRAAVRRVLDEPAFRTGAGRLRDDYATHDAPTESADLIARLVASRRPVRRPQHDRAPATAAPLA